MPQDVLHGRVQREREPPKEVHPHLPDDEQPHDVTPALSHTVLKEILEALQARLIRPGAGLEQRHSEPCRAPRETDAGAQGRFGRLSLALARVKQVGAVTRHRRRAYGSRTRASSGRRPEQVGGLEERQAQLPGQRGAEPALGEDVDLVALPLCHHTVNHDLHPRAVVLAVAHLDAGL